MDTNEVNRRVRYALSLDDADVLALLALAEFPADIDSIERWRMKSTEEGSQVCPPSAIQAMLAGLIVKLRGPRDPEQAASSAGQKQAPSAPPEVLDNNAVMKQLRIALSLKTDQVHELIVAGGGKLGKSEVNALFRKSDARNFRRCGDQVLRWFLAGLALQRKSTE